jgi:hypothetical protein
MSVVQDLWTFLGPKGVPVALAAATFATFEFLEKISSDDAKRALTISLRRLNVHKAAALPEGTRELFQRIFGKRHFSWKCLFRSACFSLGAIVLLAGLVYLSVPALGKLRWVDQLWASFGKSSVKHIDFARQAALVTLCVWVIWSLVPDYFNLLKTRICLEVMSHEKYSNIIYLVLLLMCDLLVTIAIFHVGFTVISVVSIAFVLGWDVGWAENWESGRWALLTMLSFLPAFIRNIQRVLRVAAFREQILSSILFYAGLAPSIWLWLYVGSLFTTRAILRGGPLLDWLRWFLPLDKYPFRSVGVVAAGLMFLGSAVIMVCVTYL